MVTHLITTSYLLMTLPSELFRNRCPFPTTTQRRHSRLQREEGASNPEVAPALQNSHGSGSAWGSPRVSPQPLICMNQAC